MGSTTNANFYALVEQRFPADLDSTCIETADGLTYSWGDLHHASGRIANWLASLELPAGARVAVQVEKSPECLMLYLATLRAGLVYLPLNTAYQKSEIEYFLADAQPDVVVCTPARLGEIAPLAKRAKCRQVHTLGEAREGSLLQSAAPHSDAFETRWSQPEDLAAILYTSGTTGRSKGAMLSHANLASNALTLDEFWGFAAEREAGRQDVLLHALPLFHVHGLFVAAHAALLAGAKLLLLAKFDFAQVLERLPRSTVFMGVPTYYTRLLAEPSFDRARCANMRLFISGSAPLLAETHRDFEQRTGHRILERYGMSETVMLVSNPYFADQGERIAGTVGEPLPGVGVRVVRDDGTLCPVGEIGQVQVRGPNVFSGYWRMPEKTKEEFTADGWFRTGDVGHFGGAGVPDRYLTLVGRSKDLIISGGYNVYPKEIEGYIDEMPNVVESAVIGLPHPDFGEAVAAVVVTRRAGALDATAVIDGLKGRIANYKVPKRVFVVEDLPRNTMGKVQKNVLRDRYKCTFTPPSRPSA
ncbi:MAG: malonyl-CoA synthase [Burkholderiaceae bacterium]|jgi:malonyl-CoA/methylmalonyl-CoA synthetase|nr:malonyl-CoA synthase [Burkholderiaceae bacterium]